MRRAPRTTSWRAQCGLACQAVDEVRPPTRGPGGPYEVPGGPQESRRRQLLWKIHKEVHPRNLSTYKGTLASSDTEVLDIQVVVKLIQRPRTKYDLSMVRYSSHIYHHSLRTAQLAMAWYQPSLVALNSQTSWY